MAEATLSHIAREQTNRVRVACPHGSANLQYLMYSDCQYLKFDRDVYIKFKFSSFLGKINFITLDLNGSHLAQDEKLHPLQRGHQLARLVQSCLSLYSLCKAISLFPEGI